MDCKELNLIHQIDLTHYCPVLFMVLPTENIRKPLGFLLCFQELQKSNLRL